MDAPNAAFRRKPLPGPPPGPPPPPDFDPFPQRHQPLRGALSTPNLRQSATPSIYDPPPAYEEFPGIDSRGRLAVEPPSPGPGFARAPSPALLSTGSFFPGPPTAAPFAIVQSWKATFAALPCIIKPWGVPS
ncbi:riboflavin kinase [Colletotrichum tofieldiae]|nr:riboflavin kinase [Colletotrichum tofieldiae]GKT80647.1 riboflavin kinase [Colletotrichum tofieldiae]